MGRPTPENLTKRGRGRPLGAQSKTTKSIKEMIEAALIGVGGEEYLKIQAIENPGPFMTLVGRILPKEVNNKIEGDITARINGGFTMNMFYPSQNVNESTDA